jgi:GNAT superfamily N-acetyltransferase
MNLTSAPIRAPQGDEMSDASQSKPVTDNAGGFNASRQETLNDGTYVVIRPIHEQDLALERRFIETLSPSSRRFRFLDTMLSPSVIDVDGHESEIGVGRFYATPEGHDCEFAVTVADAWQMKGLGKLLVARLIEIARSRGITQMHSSDASDNTSMRKFAEHLHFQHGRDPDDATRVLYSVDLKPATI